jgi:hypothetical protein
MPVMVRQSSVKRHDEEQDENHALAIQIDATQE